MDRAAIEALIGEVYAARLRDDLEGIMRLFTPQTCFAIAGSGEASPIACEVRGQEGFRALAAQLIETIEWQEQEIRAMLIDGNQAAVRWRGKLRHTGTGKSIVTEVFDHFVIEDGRIARMTEFGDTALLAAIMT